MAFWGTEVEPGKPFTHAPLSSRLHLSQATLGVGKGSAKQKSILQCNVGNKRPIFLCCLFPETAECCQLNLEFDESDEVVFSVIGPRTVHLTGYYPPTSSISHHNDESESYGEDIGETETERSENSEESKYDSSFINDDDDDLHVSSSSPESSARSTSNDETLDLKKYKDGRGRQRRLKKKFQISESSKDDSSQQKDSSGAVASVKGVDSEVEDLLPISGLCRGKLALNSGKDMGRNSTKEADKPNDNETKDNATMLKEINGAVGIQPESESHIRHEGKENHVLGVDNTERPKKKREELAKKERFSEANQDMIGKVVSEQNDQNQKLAGIDQVDLEDGAKLKKRKKKHAEEKTLKDNIAKEDEGQKSGLNLDSVTEDVHLEDKEIHNQVNDKKRKKRKRCKNGDGDGDALKMEPPVLSAQEEKRSVVEKEGKSANDKAIQLSNGIMIEDLEIGEQDGKIAFLGKKVRFHYTGKLRESGHVFDSSAGKALMKFRLGGEEVPELWNVGLNGMRVGSKRRLTVPASMSYRNEGASENIPPNSWLVFDVELIKVR